MLAILKKLKITELCKTTGLNLNRIRNYMGGKIKDLSPSEKQEIANYYLNIRKEIQ